MKRTGFLSRSKPMAARVAPLPRSGRLTQRNAKRVKSEFARAYGSRLRVRWVRALPCLCCGGTSENAHVVTGGMGRKADAANVVPLCFAHHHELHVTGVASFQARHTLNLRVAAERTEQAWQQYVADKPERAA